MKIKENSKDNAKNMWNIEYQILHIRKQEKKHSWYIKKTESMKN